MKKKIIVLALLFILLILLSGFQSSMLFGTEYMTTKSNSSFTVSAAFSWWNCSWPYCKRITIDHTKVESTQTNFPVLLHQTTDSDLATYAQSDGGDIVFVDRCNNSQYKHEIEKYESSTGELIAWVNVTRLSSTSDTILYMYYGNPTCENQENREDVWDINYLAIWHLNETGTGNRNDSTSNDKDCITNNYEGDEATSNGIADGADDFDGNDDYLDIPNDFGIFTGLQDFTLEAWIKSDSLTSNQTIIQLQGENHIRMDWGITDEKFRGLCRIGGSWKITESTNTFPLGWHHVVLVYKSSSGQELFVDGESGGSDDSIGSFDSITSDNAIGIGESDVATSPFNGIIDEVRISDTARTSHWINTTYQNINDSGNFSTFGTQIGVLSIWTFRKQIWINSSQIDEDLTNFPVLISTTDNNLKNKAQSNGNDIIFVPTSNDWTTSSYNDRLAHEIEEFNSSTGELVSWVNVTSISSSTNSSIYMYYGNNVCTSNLRNAEGVWDSNYVAVYHLNQTGTVNRTDSTSNDNDASTSGYEGDESTTGIIAGGDYLEGTNDQLVASDSSSFSFTNPSLTMEAWFKFDVLPPDEQSLIRKERQWQLGFIDSNTIRNLVETDGTNGWTANNDEDYTFSTGVWYYSVFIYDGATGIHIVNTSKIGPSHTITGNIVDTANNVDFGYCTNTGRFMNGTLDEIRISDIARNRSWINATCHNINNTANFLGFGGQKIKNVAPTQSNPSPSNGATGQDLNPRLSITVNDENTDSMDVTFRTNATGYWGDIGSNNSVYNGTYSQINDSMNSGNTKYWWSVNVTDGIDWINETYHFTTTASPFLYLFNGKQFVKLTDFIPGATDPEKEYTQSIDITNEINIVNSKVKLKITEELDETTYLNRIYLRINGHKIIESNIAFGEDEELLQHSDNKYLILREGDIILIEFILPNKFNNFNKIEFVAEGYYIQHFSNIK